jgi:hypothetical protein
LKSAPVALEQVPVPLLGLQNTEHPPPYLCV